MSDTEKALRNNVDAVRLLGERIGYGAVMQAAEIAWRQKLEAAGYPGGEHSVGPCAGLLVSCSCDGGCDWCEGSGRVTRRVRKAMDEAGQ